MRIGTSSPGRVNIFASATVLASMVLSSDALARSSSVSMASELIVPATALVFFLTLPINMFWYSLGCRVLMDLKAWRPRETPPLSGRDLRRRIAMTVVLMTVFYAVIDVLGEGVTTANAEGMNLMSFIYLMLIFLCVLSLSSLVLKLDLRGSMMMAAGMTLVSALTWALLSRAYGGYDRSNPMELLVIYIVFCGIMSVVLMRRIGQGPDAKNRRTKTG